MKIFQNKKIFNKLIIVLLVVMFFSFCMPKGVQASAGEIGGKLLDPLMSLFVTLGDGSMALLQKIVLGADVTIMEVDTTVNTLQKVLAIAVGYTVIVGGIACIVMSGGGATLAVAGAVVNVLKAGVITGVITFAATGYIANAVLPEDFVLPEINISPYEIFANQIPMLNVDFFTNVETEGEQQSTAQILRPVISNWYNILRNISLVALLSILVYVGIRIIISSTSADKSKYKQMLMDWIVAICLLFVMHYIMSFSNILVRKVTDVLDLVQVSIDSSSYEKEGVQLFEIDEEAKVKKAYEVLVENQEGEQAEIYKGLFDGGKTGTLYWPTDNFTEQARMMLQCIDKEDGSNNYAFASIGWKLIYCVLVVFTFVYFFTYLKRVVYMTFLTLIAPLVALTYPIDKLNDGKAQAFNMWFREYIFNLLIQPMHLLLYTVLVGSAMSFAATNIFYVVIALAFMSQGEKLLRKFFGFSKAETPGVFSGAAGAAIMMNGMNRLFAKGPKGGKALPGKGANATDNSQENGKLPRMESNIDDSFEAFSNPESEEAMKSTKEKKYNLEDQEGNLLGGFDDYETDKNGGTTMKNFKQEKGTTLELGNPVLKDGEMIPKLDNKQYIMKENPNYKDNINKSADNIGNNSKGNTNLGKAVDQSKNENKKRFWSKTKNSRLGRATTAAFRTKGDKLIKQAENEKPLRKIAGVATGIAGAAAFATAGGIAGIVDPNNAEKYIAAAAVGGYKLADGIPNSVMSKVESNADVREAAEKAWYTKQEYKEKQIQKAIEEQKRDSKFRNDLLREMGSEEEANRVWNSVGESCVRYGLRSAKDMKAIDTMIREKPEDGQPPITLQEAISAAQYQKDSGKDTTKLGYKDSVDLNNTLRERVKKNLNITPENEDRAVTRTRKMLDRFSELSR